MRAVGRRPRRCVSCSAARAMLTALDLLGITDSVTEPRSPGEGRGRGDRRHDQRVLPRSRLSVPIRNTAATKPRAHGRGRVHHAGGPIDDTTSPPRRAGGDLRSGVVKAGNRSSGSRSTCRQNSFPSVVARPSPRRHRDPGSLLPEAPGSWARSVPARSGLRRTGLPHARKPLELVL
jgi:hypothetical protein